jgi:hypothetical protein
MASKRYEFCDSCVNADIPYECRRCRDGDQFEAIDLVEELSVHELRFMSNPNQREDE